jgi:RNA methyltransferase, TrmH family
MDQVQSIQSRDNPLLVAVRKMARAGNGYRQGGALWLEGEHLCSAARAQGVQPSHAVITEAAWEQAPLRELAGWAPRVAVVPAALFTALSSLESPAGVGFVLNAPASRPIQAGAASVVLDRLQDPGNVGSILRSAAAFGFKQVLTLKGTASLWSPKVLRAGMGAHFGLHLHEGLELVDLAALKLPWVATSSHATATLGQTDLPSPCAWVLGHEGRGVAPELLARCATSVRIPQPGGEESLNVASAAAICLYESVRRASAETSPIR